MSEVMKRLLREHRTEANLWFESQSSEPVSEIEWEVASRRNLLDSLRFVDPAIAFAEELTVRLVGEGTESGQLALELSPLLDGVRRSFDEHGQVSMALSGMSKGSTVLHFRSNTPVDDCKVEPERESAEETFDMPIDSSEVDAVGRHFVELVNAAEAQKDVRQWHKMVRGLEEVTKALETFDLTAQVAWSSMSGEFVTAAFTAAGRKFVRSLSEPRQDSRERFVSGRVTELRETGYVKLKTGFSHSSPIHEVHVPAELILNLGLSLGEQAHFLTKATVKHDRVGRQLSTRLDFLRVLSANEAAALELDAL